MNASHESSPRAAFLAETHEVANVSRDLSDYSLYATDVALQEAVRREGGQWAENALTDFGQLIGSGTPTEVAQDRRVIEAYIGEE